VVVVVVRVVVVHVPLELVLGRVLVETYVKVSSLLKLNQTINYNFQH
jgi:hypothetical protein